MDHTGKPPPKSRRRSYTHKIDDLRRERAAVELKHAGHSYDSIGKKLGCTAKSARYLVKRGYDREAEKAGLTTAELKWQRRNRLEALDCGLAALLATGGDPTKLAALGGGVTVRDYLTAVAESRHLTASLIQLDGLAGVSAAGQAAGLAGTAAQAAMAPGEPQAREDVVRAAQAMVTNLVAQVARINPHAAAMFQSAVADLRVSLDQVIDQAAAGEMPGNGGPSQSGSGGPGDVPAQPGRGVPPPADQPAGHDPAPDAGRGDGG